MVEMNNTELLLQMLISAQVQTHRLLEAIATQSGCFSEATADVVLDVIHHDEKILEAATKLFTTGGDST